MDEIHKLFRGVIKNGFTVQCTNFPLSFLHTVGITYQRSEPQDTDMRH